VGDRTGVCHRTAVAAHHGAHFAGGAVAVVGQALDQQGDTVGGVALVHDVLVVGPTGLLTSTPSAGALDVVQRDRVLARLLDRVVKGRVAIGIAPASPRSNLDVLDQLREELAALGVQGGLLVLGGGPLGVAGHLSSVFYDRAAVGQSVRTDDLHEMTVHALTATDQLRMKGDGEHRSLLNRHD